MRGGVKTRIMDLNSNPTLIATHIHVLSRNKRIPAQNSGPLPEGEGTKTKKLFSVTSAVNASGFKASHPVLHLLFVPASSLPC